MKNTIQTTNEVKEVKYTNFKEVTSKFQMVQLDILNNNMPTYDAEIVGNNIDAFTETFADWFDDNFYGIKDYYQEELDELGITTDNFTAKLLEDNLDCSENDELSELASMIHAQYQDECNEVAVMNTYMTDCSDDDAEYYKEAFGLRLAYSSKYEAWFLLKTFCGAAWEDYLLVDNRENL